MSSRFLNPVFIAILVLFAPFTYASKATIERLVGEWKLEKPDPSGVILIGVHLEITSDHKFKATSFANGTPVSTYVGTFELKGSEVTWTYLHSGGALPPNFQDTDIILTINKKRFIYKSKSSTETGIYYRVK